MGYWTRLRKPERWEITDKDIGFREKVKLEIERYYE